MANRTKSNCFNSVDASAVVNTRPILLFLDDVQWLDEASSALVKCLLESFPWAAHAVAIILVANNKSCLADSGIRPLPDTASSFAYPSVPQQAQIIERGVGLKAAVADEILARTGSARETDGGLLWPLQVVAKLARAGALVRTEEGFAWANGAWPADFAIPAHMQAAIQEQWNSAAQYHAVLACAACGCEGREFSCQRACQMRWAERVLTCSSSWTRLNEQQALIHDVRDRDDVYAFHSSFLLR